jgi:hypothetical protein
LLLGSSVRDDKLTLTADLTNPDIFYDGHIALQRDAFHIVRTAYLWNNTGHQRIALQAQLAGLANTSATWATRASLNRTLSTPTTRGESAGSPLLQRMLTEVLAVEV